MRKVLYIFGLLTDGDVEWMARVGSRRRLKHGEVVIKEGEPVSYIVVVLEGMLSVTAKGVGDVVWLGAGEIVGEMSLVDSAPPSATVAADGECLALFLDKMLLLQKLETDSAFGCRFYHALAIFLADRLRANQQPSSEDEDRMSKKNEMTDIELDVGILATLSSAGERFIRMLKILGGHSHGI